jgi:hypothetical protein
MVSSDKSHIYKLIQHSRDEILKEIGKLERGFTDTGSDSPGGCGMAEYALMQQLHNLKSHILVIVLQDIAQFKAMMVGEMEGSKIASFDTVVTRVEQKCNFWREAIKGQAVLVGI